MGVTTNSTLDDLIQPIIGEARMWFAAQSLFFPKTGVAQEFLTYKDIRNAKAAAATFPLMGSVAFGDGTPGSDYTDTSALTTSGVTVTAARKVVNIPVDDLVAMSTGEANDIIATVGKAVGIAAATKFDSDVMALFASLTNTMTGVTASGAKTTAATFRKYGTALRADNVPGPYCAVFHPNGYEDFLSESSSPLLNAAASDQVAKEVWQDYYMATLFGTKIFVHSGVPADSTTDFVGGYFSPYAIGVAWKRDVTIEAQRDASAGWTEYVADMYYGVGVIDANAGCKMLQDYS